MSHYSLILPMNTSKLIQPDLEVENIQPENGVKFTEAELDRLIGFPRITIPLAVEEDTFCVNDNDEGDQLKTSDYVVIANSNTAGDDVNALVMVLTNKADPSIKGDALLALKGQI